MRVDAVVQTKVQKAFSRLKTKTHIDEVFQRSIPFPLIHPLALLPNYIPSPYAYAHARWLNLRMNTLSLSKCAKLGGSSSLSLAPFPGWQTEQKLFKNNNK